MAWAMITRPLLKLYQPHYHQLKRTLDMVICLLVLPLLVLPGLLIAIAIRLDSPGPVFFIQERVGKGGRRFKMIKFRTLEQQVDERSHRAFMKAFVNGQLKPDETHPVFKPFTAGHVTPLGCLLRKTSLDELPQLINVLKGEMSLVGPRPNVAWEVEEYAAWHKERLAVLPGITGLAQVRGRSRLAFDDIVRYDLEYIQAQSLLLDARIIWWTVTSVLGAVARPELQ